MTRRQALDIGDVVKSNPLQSDRLLHCAAHAAFELELLVEISECGGICPVLQTYDAAAECMGHVSDLDEET